MLCGKLALILEACLTLVRHLAAAVALAAFAGGTAQQARAQLAEGPGRDAVEAVCGSCHMTGLIPRSSGYTADHWRKLIATMVDVSSSPKQTDEIIAYLAANYPARSQTTSKPAAVTLDLKFDAWVVPTLGQRARDPVEAPDGSIWWVGQMGNVIGRIDPATGAMKEWKLPPRALPHSVNIDATGGVWYMGNGNGTIGKLNPATGEIREYKMPDPAARDPHTAEFDRNGIMWFTLQQSNKVGRFDPATGEIRLADMPSPRSRPYGIKVAADGSLWIACNGAPCIVNMDPATMAMKEVKLPTAGTTVRRLDLADDGTIWYVNSGAGKLGHYNPRPGAIREWASPSGASSHPYAIAVVDDMVWYNESGVRPDMLVRFDPRTETFASWPVPSDGVYAGIIRHMRPDRHGNLLIHQGATNRIMRVKTQ
jgi:virginiamycin B lyase